MTRAGEFRVIGGGTTGASVSTAVSCGRTGPWAAREPVAHPSISAASMADRPDILALPWKKRSENLRGRDSPCWHLGVMGSIIG